MRDSYINQGPQSEAYVTEIHGPRHLADLSYDELVEEGAQDGENLRLRHVKRLRRAGHLGTCAAALTLCSIFGVYWWFWHTKELALADIFNGLAPGSIFPLITIILPLIGAAGTGGSSYRNLTEPSPAEVELQAHADAVHRVVQMRNWDKHFVRDLRRRRKAIRRNPQ